MDRLLSVAGTYVRYVRLYWAKALGGLHRLFVVRGRLVAACLGAFVAAALLVAPFLPEGELDEDPKWLARIGDAADAVVRPITPRWVAFALGVPVLLVFLRSVYLARYRLVITRFVDYRDGKENDLKGLSTLLASELARLVELHQAVDDRRADPDALQVGEDIYFDQDKDAGAAMKDEAVTPTRPFAIPAAINVGLSDDHEPAISVEATMDLGWIRVPLGALTGLASRIVRGRRLTGSVHCVDDRLVLAAMSVGRGKPEVWRVEGRRGDGAGPGQKPEDLIDELATRIFSDVALKGSFKWTATRAHIEALRAYSECLRTARERRVNLEKAKQHLVEAIAEDGSFHLAHYNLGIVATELKKHDAAESAFIKAMNCNPGAWQSYYGLAQLYFAQRWYREALPLCGRIIELKERAAEGYLLRAQAWYLMDQPSQNDGKGTDEQLGAERALSEGIDRQGRGGDLDPQGKRVNHARDVRQAIKDNRAAVRRSWRRLCRATAREDAEEASEVAAKCLRNLGGMRAYAVRERIGSGGGDDPSGNGKSPAVEEDADTPAASRRQLRGYRAAQRELQQAVRLRPSNGELHFELAKLYAAQARWQPAKKHLERAVEIAPDRPRFWIQLARVHAGPYATGVPKARRPKPVEEAATDVALATRRALERPSLVIDRGFRRLERAQAFVLLPVAERERVGGLCRFANWLARWKKDWKEAGQERDEQTRRDLQIALEAKLRTALLSRDEGTILPPGEPWPVCAVGIELAHILFDRSPDRATGKDRDTARAVAEALEGCLEGLRSRHPSEIEQQDVYAVVARLLHIARSPNHTQGRAENGSGGSEEVDGRQREGTNDAEKSRVLGLADKAVTLAPLSVFAQQTLAMAHESLGHLKQAEAAWRAALALDSDVAESNTGLGNCLMLWGLQCQDRKRRRETLQAAERYLSHAVWLCEVSMDRSPTLGRARFCLGRALLELDDDERAAEEIELAREAGYSSQEARWHLARAYLQMGALARGERELRKIPYLHCSTAGDDHECEQVLLRARLELAISRIERTPDTHLRAHDATRRTSSQHDAWLRETVAMIEDIKRPAELHDGEGWRELRAACNDWLGWARFKLRDYEGAVTCLVASVELEPSPEAYSHLAQIHVGRALQTTSPLGRDEISALALDYADLARRLGLSAHRQVQLERALARLAAATTGPADRRAPSFR